jgi:hypothetical protein
MTTDNSESILRLEVLQALDSALDAFGNKCSAFSEGESSRDQGAPCAAKTITDWVLDRGRKARETMEYFWTHQSMYSQGGTLQYIHILHLNFTCDDSDERECISSLEAFWEIQLREVT